MGVAFEQTIGEDVENVFTGLIKTRLGEKVILVAHREFFGIHKCRRPFDFRIVFQQCGPGCDGRAGHLGRFPLNDDGRDQPVDALPVLLIAIIVQFIADIDGDKPPAGDPKG